jgi:hypothetical protein
MQFTLLLLAFVAIAVFTTVYWTGIPSAEKPSSSIAPNSVEEPVLSPDSRKLGANLRLRLNTPSATPERVNILLRTNGTPTDAQRTQLETLGAEIRTVAGDIVTAAIDLQQIIALSELDFVSYIELSQPLRPESL